MAPGPRSHIAASPSPACVSLAMISALLSSLRLIRSPPFLSPSLHFPRLFIPLLSCSPFAFVLSPLLYFPFSPDAPAVILAPQGGHREMLLYMLLSAHQV